MHFFNALFNTCLFVVWIFPYVQGGDKEEELMEHIRRNKNVHVRPHEDWDQPTVIYLFLGLHQIISIAEREQVLATKIMIYMEYQDKDLSWFPANFGEIESVTIHDHEFIWTPDLVIHNAISQGVKGIEVVRISYKGNVTVSYSAVISTTCDMDISYFPFDQQECNIEVGLWGSPLEEVILRWPVHYMPEGTSPGLLLMDFTESSLWHLTGSYMNHKPMELKLEGPKKGLKFSQQIYTLQLKRHPKFTILTLILPTAIISAMSIMVFVLPVESGEKMTLGITVLLAEIVNLLVLSSMLPESALNFPVLGSYFLWMIALISVGVVLAVLIIRIYHLNPTHTPPPRWLMNLSNKVGEDLSMENEEERESPNADGMYSFGPRVQEDIIPNNAAYSLIPRYMVPVSHPQSNMHELPVPPLSKNGLRRNLTSEKSVSFSQPFSESLEASLVEIKETIKQINEKDYSPWQEIAHAVDKICLCAFSAIYLIVHGTLITAVALKKA